MFGTPIKSVELVRFCVGNYRSFKEDVVVDLARLNLVFGGNSSGKSRLLRFLPYLIKCITESDFTNKNSLEDILSHTFGKRFGDNIRFSYDLKITLGSNEIMAETHSCLYRIAVDLYLINNQYPFSQKPANTNARWILLDRALSIKLLGSDGLWQDVYDATTTDINPPDEDQPEGYESEVSCSTWYEHPLFNVFLLEKLKKTSKSHRLRLGDSNILTRHLDQIKESPKSDWEKSIDSESIFWADASDHYSYPILSHCIAHWAEPQANRIPLINKLDLELLMRTHVPGPYGSGDRRRYQKGLERFFNINKAQHDSIQFLTKYFVDHINFDYLSGIRESRPFSGTAAKFVELPDRMVERYEQVDLPHMPTQFQDSDANDHFLDAINLYLGSEHLNTKYSIHRQEFISQDLLAKVEDAVGGRGVSTSDLVKQIREQGYEYRYQLFDHTTDTLVNLDEVGLGIAQVLPIVSRLAVAKDALLIFEQPELHLHPGMQTSLARLIIHSALTRGNRFLIETHSEHLIKAIQLEVARYTSSNRNKGISRTNVNVLYVSRDPDRKSSTLRKIELNKEGSFTEPWPDDFFDAGGDLSMERLRMINQMTRN